MLDAIRRQLRTALSGEDSRLTAVALAVVLCLGLGLRLLNLGRPFYGYFMWNEVYYATIARNLDHFGFLNAYNYDWTGGSALGQRHGPSPFVPWLINFSFHLFGESEAAARLPILVLGMFSLLAIYAIARDLYDAEIALIACFLAAIMPGIVFMSRQVALDSPMVAFGLASVWMLLRARRKPALDLIAIVASSVLLGTAVFIKYTGVLFLPLLGWIWWGIVGQASPRRARSRWLLMGAYLLVAALPALAWMLRGILVSSGADGGGPSTAAYLIRGSEWASYQWKPALYSIWVRTSQQTGQVLWYPLVFTGVLSVAARRTAALARRNVEIVLLIVPWFVQLIYPASWYGNDAYTYPALYGVAVLLALVVRRGARRVLELLRPPAGTTFASVVLLVATVVFASLSDYKQYYHSWYTDRDFSLNLTLQLPANLITPEDPFASARIVRSVNASHAPILADVPATVYYAQDEMWRGKATWYWWPRRGEQSALLKSIASMEYAYVVFTYQPPALVMKALCESGYAQIGPGAWRKPSSP